MFAPRKHFLFIYLYFVVTRARKALEAPLWRVLNDSTSPGDSCSNMTRPSMRRQARRGARARERCPTPLPTGASEREHDWWWQPLQRGLEARSGRGGSRGGRGVPSSRHRRRFYPAERSHFISPQSGPGSQIFFHVSLFPPLDAERLKITWANCYWNRVHTYFSEKIPFRPLSHISPACW